MGYARPPVTPCPRCRALVPPHARFCSECGTWVVHALTGAEVPMPPPMAMASPMAPVASVEYAGTLPASSAFLAALTTRDEAAAPSEQGAQPAPLELAPTAPPEVPRPPRIVQVATMVRTLDSGDLPSPSMMLGAPPVPSFGSMPVPSQAAMPVPSQGSMPLAPPLVDMPPLPEPSRERTLSRASKTIADERPSVAPSVSLGKPPRPLGAFLVSYQYEPLGTFWPLGVGGNLVGRAGSGRPDLDVGISDATVSSEQALIEVDARQITVEDRGSRNGTTVNGRSAAAGTKVPVVHGDRIKFGSFETIVVQVPYPAGS